MIIYVYVFITGQLLHAKYLFTCIQNIINYIFLIWYYFFFRHLNQEREFVTSHEYISITEYTKGEITLPEFCVKAKEASSDQTNSNAHCHKPALKISE